MSSSEQVTGAREPRTTRRLVRYGFAGADRAAGLLGPAGLGLWDADDARPVDADAERVLETLASTADPDLALRQLHRLAEAGQRGRGEHGFVDVMERLRGDQAVQVRLLTVLGASTALGDHLVANPAEWRVLESPVPSADLEVDLPVEPETGPETDPVADSEPAPQIAPPIMKLAARHAVENDHKFMIGADGVPGLRMAYRRELLRIAADDLTGVADVVDTMTALSRLADATLQAAFRLAGGGDDTRLGIIAMGKCGGGELNYVSDVDVIFVCRDDEDIAPTTTIAIKLMQICSQVAWPVDAALRPEGGRGPLVRTLAGHIAYYHKWARTWEFQALLKARPAAGDIALGHEWQDALQDLIWHAAERPEAVGDIRAMRRRIIDAVPRNELDREIKRGPGGLRDIEFAVQLLQLVHGRADETLRSPSTMDALAALIAGGYVGRADGEALLRAYRFLRTVEHRLQLQRLRRTHTVPTDPAEVQWLAQALGYRSGPERDAIAAFRSDWIGHATEVRRLHAKLFYRPLLEAVARVPSDDLRLTADAAQHRLEVLGFADPAGALRHIQALTGGVTRTAAIQHTLLPALLSEFADEPEPDRGLLAYRQVSESLGSTPWYLRLLRDGGPVALRLAALLGRSRYATDLLTRDPEALRLLADDRELEPRPLDVLLAGFAAAAGRHGTALFAAQAVRALRRRELFRTAAADLTGVITGPDAVEPWPGLGADVERTGNALTDITDATLAAVLTSALQVAHETAPGLRFAIIGMGRLGGRELNYASDADVLFVYEPPPGIAEDVASGAAHAVAEQLRRVLSSPASDPPLGIDADLRPEGRQGPLVRSVAAYQHYYARWSKVWEAQALLRARFIAGDPDVGTRFLALADRIRYPVRGLMPEQVTEIRRIKARIDSERIPRGADPATHAKLGRGGLADVEWAVQLTQLRHGRQVEGLRTTRTLPALAAARDAGLVSGPDADALAEAWILASRVRNALMLVRGRASDQLPRHGPELAGVVRVLGAGDPGEFVDQYLRTARHARTTFERLFDR